MTLNSKQVQVNDYLIRVYVTNPRARVREHLNVDLLSKNVDFAVSWPGRCNSRRWLFRLPVKGSGVATIRKAILRKSELASYHKHAEELAKAINKARLVFRARVLELERMTRVTLR